MARSPAPVRGTSGATAPSTVDDAVLFLARLSGGGVASFEASRLATGYHNANRFEIHGDRGALRFNFERLNELDFYDLSNDAAVQGWTTIDVTRAGCRPSVCRCVVARQPRTRLRARIRQSGQRHPRRDRWRYAGRARSPTSLMRLLTQRVLHAAIESARNRAPVALSEI